MTRYGTAMLLLAGALCVSATLADNVERKVLGSEEACGNKDGPYEGAICTDGYDCMDKVTLAENKSVRSPADADYAATKDCASSA